MQSPLHSISRKIQPITPYFVVDYEKCRANCIKMRAVARTLRARYRPHVKTHKTLEIAILQHTANESSVPSDISIKLNDPTAKGPVVVSTLSELVFYLRHGWADIIYGIPLIAKRVPLIAKIQKSFPLAKIGVIIDSSTVISSIQKLRGPKNWTIYLGLDCGYGREGISNITKLTNLAVKLAAMPNCSVVGVYSHSGHAYKAHHSSDSIIYLMEEIRLGYKAADSFLKVSAFSGRFVVSIGSTPTCSTSLPLDPSMLLDWPHSPNSQIILEIHPGNATFYDLQQYSIGSCSISEIACHVETTILGVYSSRKSFLVDAGALALSKDTVNLNLDNIQYCYGAIVDSEEEYIIPIDSVSQEEGKCAHLSPTLMKKLSVGKQTSILPAHSCLTAACFPHYFIRYKGKIVDCWTPCKYWSINIDELV